MSLLTAAALIQLRVFLPLERQMHRTGGPGIIPFELAGSQRRARHIMTTWGEEGRRAARQSLALDFLFPATYGPLQALLCELAGDVWKWREHRAWGRAAGVFAWSQLTAAGFDYIENASLLLVLAGRDRWLPRLARRAALVKFTCSGLGGAYMLLALITGMRRR